MRQLQLYLPSEDSAGSVHPYDEEADPCREKKEIAAAVQNFCHYANNMNLWEISTEQ